MAAAAAEGNYLFRQYCQVRFGPTEWPFYLSLCQANTHQDDLRIHLVSFNFSQTLHLLIKLEPPISISVQNGDCPWGFRTMEALRESRVNEYEDLLSLGFDTLRKKNYPQFNNLENGFLESGLVQDLLDRASLNATSPSMREAWTREVRPYNFIEEPQLFILREMFSLAQSPKSEGIALGLEEDHNIFKLRVELSKFEDKSPLGQALNRCGMEKVVLRLYFHPLLYPLLPPQVEFVTPRLCAIYGEPCQVLVEAIRPFWPDSWTKFQILQSCLQNLHTTLEFCSVVDLVLPNSYLTLEDCLLQLSVLSTIQTYHSNGIQPCQRWEALLPLLQTLRKELDFFSRTGSLHLGKGWCPYFPVENPEHSQVEPRLMASIIESSKLLLHLKNEIQEGDHELDSEPHLMVLHQSLGILNSLLELDSFLVEQEYFEEALEKLLLKLEVATDLEDCYVTSLTFGELLSATILLLEILMAQDTKPWLSLFMI